MARGSNGNPTRGRDSNPSTHTHIGHDHYHSIITAASASTPTPNDPLPTSGTLASFNNFGQGSQDFRHATVNSGSRSASSGSGTLCSFNNAGSGSQDFQGAKISTAAVTLQPPNRFFRSPASRIARMLHIGNANHCSGTVHSFNNHANGSQNFNGADINTGANSPNL
ncbi:uncharacterized protein LOC109813224 [Cajanus cajan]|uniref:uncharacterized protein LOC109813224 n=1 Tax=Cajanus cajan TaxID=3821 RepID=UPI00098DAF8D|nr:uncharacterized protein LOC109813224 [Cajanus cajan]XP_029130183.1 uncharacterized protein LOC109813224 [Cajanus cajan]